jgi:hypothetical protein
MLRYDIPATTSCSSTTTRRRGRSPRQCSPRSALRRVDRWTACATIRSTTGTQQGYQVPIPLADSTDLRRRDEHDLRLDGGTTIADVAFDGRSCAISQASSI